MNTLNDLSLEELKVWVRDCLQMTGEAAVAINVRSDESPFEFLLNIWKKATGDFRKNFQTVVLELVEEVGDIGWEPKHFHQLALLIEVGNFFKSEYVLEDFVYSRRLFLLKNGPQLHMLALRTLLAIGWRGNTEFWLAQYKILKGQWCELIFDALTHHDLEMAFKITFNSGINKESMRKITNIFPSLLREGKVDLKLLGDLTLKYKNELSEDSLKIVENWFLLQGHVLTLSVSKKYASLWEGIRGKLGNVDLKPISPRLCDRALCEAH